MRGFTQNCAHSHNEYHYRCTMSGTDERPSSAICFHVDRCIESDPFALGTLTKPYLTDNFDSEDLIQAPEVLLPKETASWGRNPKKINYYLKHLYLSKSRRSAYFQLSHPSRIPRAGSDLWCNEMTSRR